MNTADLNLIKKDLLEGKTILYPTDTIWGVGCDATNEAAVEKILAIKNRPSSKSLVCLVSHDAMLNQFIEEVSEVAWDLIDETDNPLTLVLPGAKGFAVGELQPGSPHSTAARGADVRGARQPKPGTTSKKCHDADEKAEA